MSYRFFILLGTVSTLMWLSIASLTSASPKNPEKAAADEKWKLVFQEDFNGSKLDQKSWRVIKGNGCPQICGFGNNELQAYGSNNAVVKDGKLTITASPEKGMDRDYQSAKITTQPLGGWTYAKVSVRAKLPKGLGTWPAIWMLPVDNKYGGWPASGELDIMEHVGHDMGVVHGTIHTTAYNGMIKTQIGKQINLPDAHTTFHTYSLIWQEDKLTWQVDGVDYFTLTKKADDKVAEWPFDHPYYLILNLAVGGDWGGQKGVNPDHYPTSFVVDWVKVWQEQ